ncbi:MAG: DUF4364 family protein [Christensenellaceae bacterium]|jgi:hypothetical protein|nr:DUF4364 family protein [Christensenellaceae bacterium]
MGSMIHDEGINNKLLALFVLEKLEIPISEDVFLQICCIDNNWIPYLYCLQVIQELISNGFIARTLAVAINKNFLTLTADGRTCLAHFYNDIAASVRESVAKYVREERINFKKKQEFQADYYKNADGTFTVVLKILDAVRPIFELKYIVTNRAIATSIYNSWDKKAQELYMALSDVLLESE